jgi:hypothetical protein
LEAARGLRHGGEVRADDLIPIEDDVRLAEAFGKIICARQAVRRPRAAPLPLNAPRLRESLTDNPPRTTSLTERLHS